jgi:hypothetical protein
MGACTGGHHGGHGVRGGRGSVDTTVSRRNCVGYVDCRARGRTLRRVKGEMAVVRSELT